MTESTKRKWTGGEWHALFSHSEANIVAHDPNTVAVTVAKLADNPWKDAVIANAHLLAASKKLFEALNEIHSGYLAESAESNRFDWAEWNKKAIEALQSALGEGE